MLLRHFTGDEMYIRIRFFLKFRKLLNLKNPSSFNAKINWLKLYDRNPLYTKLADKYAVRQYVAECIGSKYLNEVIDFYDSVEEIDFAKLPTSFVLNTTHGSNWIYICKDKSLLDEELCKSQLSTWLKSNYYSKWGEPVYEKIQPRIKCERYLENRNENWLIDYKIFCFNGIPEYIHVDREIDFSYTRNFYDLDWNRLNFGLAYPQSTFDVPRPKKLSELINLARSLSKGLKFVRVDFYIIEDNIYFGEFTFYPDNGFGRFEPSKIDEEMGKKIVLNNHV